MKRCTKIDDARILSTYASQMLSAERRVSVSLFKQMPRKSLRNWIRYAAQSWC
jgi:hypothetical protein